LAQLLAEGLAAAAPTLRNAVRAVRDDQTVHPWGVVAETAAAAALWDFESWDVLVTRHLQLARDAGALALLAIALESKAIVATWSGNFSGAVSLIAEADAVTGATGIRMASYGGMLLAAYQGREAEASALLRTTIENATASGEGVAVQVARWATAVLFNGLGRYGEALVAARQASDATRELYISHWALAELVEACVRSGNSDLAANALGRLVAATAASGSEWGFGIVARSRALVSEDEAAETLYLEAITRLGRTRLWRELARAPLLYGEWLRRENRRVDARGQLRTASELFVGFGADAF